MRASGARRGFGLAEVLLCAALVVTSFLFVIGVFPVSARAIQQGRLRTLALQVAQYQMEDLEQSFAADTYLPTRSVTYAPRVNGVSQNLRFDAQTTVSPVNLGMYDVRVLVSWTHGGEMGYVELESMLPGP